jgi:hypothetical protein
VYVLRVAQMQSDLLLDDLANGYDRARGPAWSGPYVRCIVGHMYAACNNTIYSSSNGANACRPYYCMGVLNYTFRAFSKLNTVNRSADTLGSGCLHTLRFSIPCTFPTRTCRILSNRELFYSLMYFFSPLSLSLACSSTSSSLQTANRSQSSAR